MNFFIRAACIIGLQIQGFLQCCSSQYVARAWMQSRKVTSLTGVTYILLDTTVYIPGRLIHLAIYCVIVLGLPLPDTVAVMLEGGPEEKGQAEKSCLLVLTLD